MIGQFFAGREFNLPILIEQAKHQPDIASLGPRPQLIEEGLPPGQFEHARTQLSGQFTVIRADMKIQILPFGRSSYFAQLPIGRG